LKLHSNNSLPSLIRRIVFICIFAHLHIYTSAQVFPPKNYPKGYFRWPLGNIPGIAANFGELRPNHYHMGLDCRTDSHENMPVYAAAEGYIAKVTIDPSGFGRSIRINHPNGLTTLYAHLNDFNPALEKYITEQQYRQETWKIEVDIPANLFPVKKGDFIAYSGNTGGSQGPHTHFEIRDTKTDKVLNPLLFGMPIPDNVPPQILRLCMYDRTMSVYEQSPHFYPIRKINGVYVSTPSVIIANSDKVSFAISAVDKYTGSNNPNGIYQAILFEDEKPIVGFQIDSITYEETRYVNAHIDYKLRSNGGPFVEHLSRLPGYPQGIYKDINGDGVITLNDDNIHHIKVEVKDTYGNTSLLKFDVKRGAVKTWQSSNQREFYPGFVNVFENNDISFYLPENDLYDSIHLQFKEIAATNPNAASPVFQINSGLIPSHVYFPVKIKSNLNNADKDKMVMHRYWGEKNDYAKADYDNGWYKASFREFGYFQLIADNTPPTITPVGFRDGMNCRGIGRIAFIVKDNTKEVNFRAELDGTWLRFTNDKNEAFIYKFDYHCAPGHHELKIIAKDCVGNVAEKLYNFTR
jgi:murein DD-endopeptidase MepM/ murein hydrolase activator NlpD